MDYLPEYVTSLLHHPAVQHLAASPLASNVAHLHETYLNPTIAHVRDTYVDPSLTHVRSTYLEPYIIQPFAHLLTHLLADMPDVASVLLLLLILFLSLKAVDYARRFVMFWISMAIRIVWWGIVISLGIYLYQAGWDTVVRDVGRFFAVALGLAEQFCNGLEGVMTEGNGDRQRSVRTR